MFQLLLKIDMHVFYCFIIENIFSRIFELLAQMFVAHSEYSVFIILQMFWLLLREKSGFALFFWAVAREKKNCSVVVVNAKTNLLLKHWLTILMKKVNIRIGLI